MTTEDAIAKSIRKIIPNITDKGDHLQIDNIYGSVKLPKLQNSQISSKATKFR